MDEPIPAEIEAGVEALVQLNAEMTGWTVVPWETIAERVLRTVLPDHDARVRAQERDRLVAGLLQLGLLAPPADVARTRTNPPEET